MNFRWLSIQIMFQVNLVGVQKLVLNCLEKWSSRIKKEKEKKLLMPRNQFPLSLNILVMI